MTPGKVITQSSHQHATLHCSTTGVRIELLCTLQCRVRTCQKPLKVKTFLRKFPTFTCYNPEVVRQSLDQYKGPVYTLHCHCHHVPPHTDSDLILEPYQSMGLLNSKYAPRRMCPITSLQEPACAATVPAFNSLAILPLNLCACLRSVL